MGVARIFTFLFICISLLLSVILSFRSFTGYLISDIQDTNSNLTSFVFLMIGLFLTWVYIYKFKPKQQ